MLKVILAVMTIIATTAAAQTVWDGTIDTAWFANNRNARTFTITTAEELAGLAALVNRATNPIDFDERTINLGANIMLNDTTDWLDWEETAPLRTWTPIGTSETRAFNGTFNGNGLVVSGVYMNNSSGSRGLFGCLGWGEIRNTGVIASYIRGGSSIGGLVGQNNNGTINNSYSTGNVVGTASVGGLVGSNRGTISNSYATGNIHSSSTSSITRIGGLVGENRGAISNSYATGNVQSSGGYVGGLVGDNISGTIRNSYSTGNVQGTGSFVGGLTGSGSAINSYYDRETSEQSDMRGRPLTTAEMKHRAFVYMLNVQALNLSMNAWLWVEGDYPILTNTPATQDILDRFVFFDNGDGTENNPYVIKTKEDLENFLLIVNLNGSFSNTHFQFSFFGDGSGTQDNPYIITTKEQLEDFRSLTIEGRYNFAGKYIRLDNNIALNNIENWLDWDLDPPANSWLPIGTFNGTFDGNGHLISGVYISNESNNRGFFGTIGATGAVKNLGIVDSYIRGGSQIGGLAGENQGTVSNSYSTARIRGISNVGGLVGRNISAGAINNSYSTGRVQGTGSNIGGLVGSSNSSRVTNSYYDSQTSQQSDNTKGTPRTTAQMRQRATFVGWDFNYTWGIEEGVSYPYFLTDVEIVVEDVSVVWSSQTQFVYNGSSQSPSATATTSSGLPVPLTISGGVNVGTHTATARLATWNPAINLIGATQEFTINRANISPILNIASSITVGSPVSPSVIGNSGNGQITYVYSTTPDGTPIPIPTEVGTYWVKAVIAQTQNFNGAETPSVLFSIVAVSAQEVEVVWGEQNVFTYDGTMQAPSASAMISGATIPLTVVGGINAGLHTATARLATPSANIILTNATKEFTINPKELSPNAITPIGNFLNTGFQIRPDIEVKDGDKILREGIDFSELTYGDNIIGTGTVSVTGIGNYTGTVSRTFVIASMGATFVNVIWSNTGPFTFNGQEQFPTATAGSYEIEIIGKQTNAGSHTAVAQLKDMNQSVILLNAVRPYNIDRKELQVNWTEQRVFVFNKMVQVPLPSVSESGVTLSVLNGQSQVGKYEGVLAPFAMITSSNANNYILTNYRIDGYEITRRPLNVVMRDRNGNIRDTITAEEEIRISGELFDYIESVLDYDNFATDTTRNETDDKNVLRGKPRFSIQDDDSQRSLRNNNVLPERNIVLKIGERFLVNVITDSITADNYIIPPRKIFVTITEKFITITTDPRDDDPVSIVNIKKSDSRHGIKFAKNIVSDKAEINVVLPNNERATETKIVIYDMTGNVVFASTGSATGAVWDLRNTAGRIVANGTYLVIAEVKTANGKTHVYSSRLGVKR